MNEKNVKHQLRNISCSFTNLLCYNLTVKYFIWSGLSFFQYWLFLCTLKIRSQRLRGCFSNFCALLESYLVWEGTFLFSDGDV